MITDIYLSFRAMPAWVQVWVLLILVPVNMASLWFLNEPWGTWVAILAIGAMLLNLPVMLKDRGFGKMMALPHLLPWTVLVVWLAFFRPVGSDCYTQYLLLLMIVNAISLAFDYPDAIKWFKGDRAAARPN